METTIIGLGLMGGEMARVLLRAGHRVTVWNRSAAKADPLVREGAVRVASAAAAVGASRVVIVCVADYNATREVLEAKDVVAALAGRVIVQLTTGTPQEARDLEAWVRGRGAEYLDGAIMATPSQIGRPDTTILASGAASAYETSAPLVKAIAGNLVYLGDRVGAASAMDLAALAFWFGGILGFVHGTRICESEGLRVDALGSMVAGLAPVIAEQNKKMSEQIQSGEYGKPEASIRTCAVAIDLMLRQARDAGINAEFPTFALDLFRRTEAAGYGEEDVAALVKVLRGAA